MSKRKVKTEQEKNEEAKVQLVLKELGRALRLLAQVEQCLETASIRASHVTMSGDTLKLLRETEVLASRAKREVVVLMNRIPANN